MSRCGICGRPGNWLQGICDTCRQTEALKERNRIDKDRLRSEEEQRKRDKERYEREQRNRDEQLRQERERDERNQRLREEQLRLDKERDEQDRIFREEQLRLEQERNEQEREDRVRAIKAQEEANRIEQQRYEDEQRAKNAREWAERKDYLNHLSNEEIKKIFENSEFLFTGERDYLESRYRCSLLKEEELEFIKDKEKFLAKKNIKNGIESFSFDESLIYSFISTIDVRWFEEIIERENYLKEFPQFNFKIVPELEEEYRSAANSRQRQEIIGTNGFIIRFKNKSTIDRQIYFREFIQNECKNVFDEEYAFDNALGLFWGIGPVLKDESDDAIRLFWNSDRSKFYRAKHAYLFFSKIEPLYIEALNQDERKEYLKKKESAESEGERFLESIKQKDKDDKAARQKQQEEYQLEFNEKIQENDKLVLECNEINKRRDERLLLYEKRKKSRKNTIRIGCASPFIILFIIGTFILPSNNQVMLLSAAAIVLLPFIALIRTILLSVKMKKLLKEDAKDDVTQNGIVEKSKQLVARLNELQKLLSK
ncbi:MAG: hypothetical protein J6Q11_05570 [Fibrobacteraceae bacterium]|nr:hypothetical protein [Fibrobacteraceae bacterium]